MLSGQVTEASETDTVAPLAPAPTAGKRVSPVLVEGPIAKTLLLFSLPILGSSVLQSLNASINAVWIGRLIGRTAWAPAATPTLSCSC